MAPVDCAHAEATGNAMANAKAASLQAVGNEFTCFDTVVSPAVHPGFSLRNPATRYPA
jgi:hypothetical protein